MDVDIFLNDRVELLKRMISIPSISREENQLADFLEVVLKEKNYRPWRKGNNIWLTTPEWNDQKPTILLNSHIDTVKPVAGWTKDPFSPHEEEGKLFGLGANDAGASLVSLLQAFMILTQTQQENNFFFWLPVKKKYRGKMVSNLFCLNCRR